MPRVVIRGTTPSGVTIEIDGQRPQLVRAFRLLGNHPDEPVILQLDMDVTDVDIDVDQAVVEQNRQTITNDPAINQLREELEGAYRRIRELERGLVVTREGTRGYQGPQPSRNQAVERIQRDQARRRELQRIAQATQVPLAHNVAPSQPIHPRRRRRSNLRWRQRYNEIFDEMYSDHSSLVEVAERARFRVQEEMNAGGDPDPGRVFPAVTDDTGRTADSRAQSVTTGSSGDPQGARDTFSVFSRVLDSIGATPERSRVADPSTAQRLNRENFARACADRCGRERLALIQDVETWSYNNDRNVLHWTRLSNREFDRMIDGARYLLIQTPAEDFLIVNERREYSPQDRTITGEGAVIDRRSLQPRPVLESQWMPRDIVLEFDEGFQAPIPRRAEPVLADPPPYIFRPMAAADLNALYDSAMRLSDFPVDSPGDAGAP